MLEEGEEGGEQALAAVEGQPFFDLSCMFQIRFENRPLESS